MNNEFNGFNINNESNNTDTMNVNNNPQDFSNVNLNDNNLNSEPVQSQEMFNQAPIADQTPVDMVTPVDVPQGEPTLTESSQVESNPVEVQPQQDVQLQPELPTENIIDTPALSETVQPQEDNNKKDKYKKLLPLLLLLLLLICGGLLLSPLSPFKNDDSGSTSGKETKNGKSSKSYDENIVNLSKTLTVYYNVNKNFVAETSSVSYNDREKDYTLSTKDNKGSFASIAISTSPRSFEKWKECSKDNHSTVCPESLYGEYENLLKPVFSTTTVLESDIVTDTITVSGTAYFHQKCYAVYQREDGTKYRATRELYIAKGDDNSSYKVSFIGYNYADDSTKFELTDDLVKEFLDIKVVTSKK